MEQISETSQLSGESERSTGELIKLMSEQVSTLVRDELKLAQLEMTHKDKQAGISAASPRPAIAALSSNRVALTVVSGLRRT